MAKDQLNNRINLLLAQEKWEKARRLLETEREKNPHSHWVLTQLAVTFYESKQYSDALNLLLESLEIKDDCPLTLWNLAGTLDALGQYDEAQGIYKWILKSKKSSEDDLCWEDDEWTATLKADSVFRLGDTAMHQGNNSLAERFYRDYLDLWLAGIKGSYAIEEVARDVQLSRGSEMPSSVKKQSRHITTSGTIPRSALKQSALIYAPVVKIATFLRHNRDAWRQVASQSSSPAASSFENRKRAKKAIRRVK